MKKTHFELQCKLVSSTGCLKRRDAKRKKGVRNCQINYTCTYLHNLTKSFALPMLITCII